MGFSIPNRTAFLTEKIYIKKVTAKSITDVDVFGKGDRRKVWVPLVS